MKTAVRNITCANCGKVFKARVKLSSFSRDFGLDGKPDNPGFLPFIFDCPDCGYAGYKIEGAKPVIPEDYVIDRNNPYDAYERALILADSDDVKNHLLMEYSWKLEFDGKTEDAKKVRERAVSQMELSLMKRPIIELIFVYIDFLRQLERFDEAEAAVDTISPVVTADADKKPRFYKRFIYLQKLIKDRDAAPHMISEV